MEAVVKSELSFNNILIRYGFNFYLDRGGGVGTRRETTCLYFKPTKVSYSSTYNIS